MKNKEQELWDYLKRKFKNLNDNNKTAKQVFSKVLNLYDL